MNLHAILESQYRASLEMLHRTITACPEHLWNDSAHGNRYWRIAYHTLFYTHLYLSHREEEFVPFHRAIQDANFLHVPLSSQDAMNTRDELLEYVEHVGAVLGELLPSDNLEGSSGFDWISFSRMELHVYNIRHIQHHTGQLIERLRAAGEPGVAWVGLWREPLKAEG